LENNQEMLAELNSRLRLHFKALRHERGESRPVHFIEHDLDEARLADLIAELQVGADQHPLHHWWWDSRRLPLLVATTEAGYRYRGNGTEYWALLEQDLGRELTEAERDKLREFFEAEEPATGVRPADTEWNQAFRRIAWPVTHAVAPAELHQPLLTAVLSAPPGLDEGLADSEAIAPLQHWADRRGSLKLQAFLARPEIAAPVVRSLLKTGEEQQVLTQDFLRRVARDIEQNQFARKDLRRARRELTKPSVRRRRPPSASSVTPAGKRLRFFLELGDEDESAQLWLAYRSDNKRYVHSAEVAMRD